MVKNIFLFFSILFCLQNANAQAEIKFVNPIINGTNYQVSIAIKSSVANTNFQLGNVTLRILYDNAPFSGLPTLLSGHDFNGTIISNATNHNFTATKGLFNIGVAQSGIVVTDAYKVLGTLQFNITNNTALLDTLNKISLSLAYPMSSVVKIVGNVESNASIINTPTPYVNSGGGVKLTAKVFLNSVNSSGLMDAFLPELTGLTPASANFPLSDPYSVAPYSTYFQHVNNGAVQITNANILTQYDGNKRDIVDWMFLELRTGASADVSTVVYTQAAFIESDGYIVDAKDGISPVDFTNAPDGNYFIGVRHRNHLGFITQNKVSLSKAYAKTFDFTNNSVPLYANNIPTITKGSFEVMIGGDANIDGQIDSADKAIWNSNNGLGGYSYDADFNIDGQVDSSDKSIWNANNGL